MGEARGGEWSFRAGTPGIRFLGLSKGRHSPCHQDSHGFLGKVDVGLGGDYLYDYPRWKGT